MEKEHEREEGERVRKIQNVCICKENVLKESMVCERKCVSVCARV